MKDSEPCTRGGWKCTHQAFVFLEEIKAVEARLTHVALLSSTLEGGSHWQAPRVPTIIWRDAWWDSWFFDDRSESGSFGCQAVPFLTGEFLC